MKRDSDGRLIDYDEPPSRNQPSTGLLVAEMTAAWRTAGVAYSFDSEMISKDEEGAFAWVAEDAAIAPSGDDDDRADGPYVAAQGTVVDQLISDLSRAILSPAGVNAEEVSPYWKGPSRPSAGA
mgnify:FL=1